MLASRKKSFLFDDGVNLLRAEEISKQHADRRVGALLEFWRKSCGVHTIPSQADLDLVSIPRLLPNVFIIDAVENRTFRYRYMGTALDAHLGTSLTGRTFDAFRSGRVLEEITAFFMRVITHFEMGILTTRLPSETLGTATYTRVGLPIADDHKTPNKVLGLLLFENPPRASISEPYVFDIKNEERGIVKSVFGTL